MTDGYLNCIDELASRGILPTNVHAVVISGSVIRGWGNDASDIDVYVIVDEPWESDTSTRHPLPVSPGYISGEEAVVNERRWDVRYWLDSQIDQVIAKVGPADVQRRDNELGGIISPEIAMLDRLTFGIAPAHSDWLRARQDRIAASAFRSAVAQRALNFCDAATEDALGQLRAGDLESAVISARHAFGWAVDALMAGLGDCGQNEKWRPRRVRERQSTVLSFDDYWAVETMRTFDRNDPEPWIVAALTWCRKISMEVMV